MQLNAEARQLLVDSYVHLRKNDTAPGSRVAYRMTVRQLEALIRLSEAIARCHLDDEFQDENIEHGDNEENGDIGENGEAQPGGADADANNMNPENADGAGGKKLVITDEYFQRVTQALVMRLRQHEEMVQREGSGLAGMRQRDLIQWYVKQRNESEAYENEEEAKAEVTKVKAIIESLVRREGHLIVVNEEEVPPQGEDDGNARRPSRNNRILAVAPNYVLDQLD
ncbi:putative DNA helicase [Helianthus annuus]|nr:putative DNA helicase [Helianthus annuus]